MVIWRRKRSGERPQEWENDETGEVEDQDYDPFFGAGEDPFRDFDDQFRRMRAQMNRMMQGMAQGELKSPGEGGPYVYGWSMRVGPDGVPKIQTFGNVQNPAMRAGRALPGETPQQAASGAVPGEVAAGPGVREPLTDICAEGKTITVTAEMPGIEKDDIELETGDDFLIIKVEKGTRRYYKELELPSRVVAGSTRAKYNNGVLEIALEKAPGEKKGTRVLIE